MNTYRTEFSALCPQHGTRLKFRLAIHSRDAIAVDDIRGATKDVRAIGHEALADQLYERLGGTQYMTADHHGVVISTRRPYARPTEGRA